MILECDNVESYNVCCPLQEKIKKFNAESQATSTTSVREDALSAVLGNDRPGRLRGMGRGMTHTKFVLSQANQKQTMQLQNRVADLEKMVQMLVSQNQVFLKRMAISYNLYLEISYLHSVSLES